MQLANDPTAFPFEKHLAGKKALFERLSQGGWTVGNAAARHGLDLRIFYKARLPQPDQAPTMTGAGSFQ